jgi:hypothetical protein
MPSIAPRSSTIIAICCRSWRICRIASDTRSVSGKNSAGPPADRTVRVEQVQDVYDADNLVQATLADDGRAGVPGADQFPHAVDGRQGGGQDGDLAPRDEDLPQGPFCDLERSAEDCPLLRREAPLRDHDVASLLDADLGAGRFGITAG